MTSITYSVWYLNDLRVAIPHTDPITHYDIDYERFQLVDNDLIRNGWVVYEVDGDTLRKGKDYDLWFQWVNEPAVLERLEAEERAYEEWLEDQWKED